MSDDLPNPPLVIAGQGIVVGPNDVLIVIVPNDGSISDDVRDQLIRELQRLAPDRGLLIQADGVQVATIEPVR